MEPGAGLSPFWMGWPSAVQWERSRDVSSECARARALRDKVGGDERRLTIGVVVAIVAAGDGLARDGVLRRLVIERALR